MQRKFLEQIIGGGCRAQEGLPQPRGQTEQEWSKRGHYRLQRGGPGDGVLRTHGRSLAASVFPRKYLARSSDENY